MLLSKLPGVEAKVAVEVCPCTVDERLLLLLLSGPLLIVGFA